MQLPALDPEMGIQESVLYHTARLVTSGGPQTSCEKHFGKCKCSSLGRQRWRPAWQSVLCTCNKGRRSGGGSRRRAHGRQLGGKQESAEEGDKGDPSREEGRK